jgi:peptide/nickel transport system permease protein
MVVQMARKLALCTLLLLTLACFSVPLLAKLLHIEPLQVSLAHRYDVASGNHFLGRDELGRDVLLRLLQGGAVSLLVAAVTTTFTLMIGTLIGLCAGYFGGRTDQVLMRLTDAVIAMPLLPLLIVLAAVDTRALGLSSGGMGEGVKLVLILSLVGWTTVARLVRSEALSLRAQDFVRAAIALGSSAPRLLYRHILPNIRHTLGTAAALTFIKVLLLEAGLSFLGMGILPPNPTLGNLLMNAQYDLQTAPHLAIYPGVMLTVIVLCLLVLSDAPLTKQGRSR